MAASILIADDDAVQRRLVENMVQKCGYETTVVDSGDAAIALLTAPDAPMFDAMVLDLVMPGLDGMGVLAKIREAGLSDSRRGADRPWRHRQCGVGDARRRAGFCRKTGRLRAAAGAAPQRAQHQRAERRTAAHQAQPRRQADLCRHHHPQRGHGRRDAHRAEGRRLDDPGVDRGRIRRRQGIVRTRHPWQRRAQIEAVRCRQLRRDPRQSGGVDPVRPREGRLYRRHRTPHGQIRRSLRRHAVPR